MNPEEARKAVNMAINDLIDTPDSGFFRAAIHEAIDRAIEVAVDCAKEAEAHAWAEVIALVTGFGFPKSIKEAEELIRKYGQDCIRLAFQAQSIQTWSQPCPRHSDLSYLEPVKKWRKANPTHCFGCFFEALDIRIFCSVTAPEDWPMEFREKFPPENK